MRARDTSVSMQIIIYYLLKKKKKKKQLQAEKKITN